MVIIIGGGPIGLACGIELQKRHIPFLIIEKGSIVDSIYHYPVNMTFFSTSDRLELGNVPFISHGSKPTRREALDYYRRVTTSFNLPINLYEEVEKVDGVDGAFIIKTNKKSYEASKVIVATGFYGLPNLLGIPGEKLPKVKHYYDEPHPYAKQKIAVIGAGNSAVDVALETFRNGAEVTMVIRGAAIKESVKYWVKPDIENRIKSGEIASYFYSTLKEIREHEILIQTPDGEKVLENDFVLAMTGYTPNYSLLNNLGIPYENDSFKTPIYDENTQESAKKGMYVAGVVCGGLQTNKWFIENAREHAVQIANDIRTKIK
jgi:putative YpdA family bacillithiol system oxidoreductase